MTRPLTIPHLAVEAAKRWPKADAIVDGDVRLSFADLEAKMIEAAAAFIAADLEKGECVAIWAQNSADWVIALLLAWLATSVILLSATYLFRWLGESVLTALERVMGMLLNALSVQMFLGGVASFLHLAI